MTSGTFYSKVNWMMTHFVHP